MQVFFLDEQKKMKIGSVHLPIARHVISRMLLFILLRVFILLSCNMRSGPIVGSSPSRPKKTS